MGAIVVKGPCNGPIEVQVDGTIIAPANPAALHDAYEWIKFEYVDFFTLSGKGVFDGQGAIAWNQNDCGKNKNCDMASMVNIYIIFSHIVSIKNIADKMSLNVNRTSVLIS